MTVHTYSMFKRVRNHFIFTTTLKHPGTICYKRCRRQQRGATTDDFLHWFEFFFVLLSDTKKKRTNFLCSIICCLGKKSTKLKGSKGDSANSSVKGGGGGGGGGAGGLIGLKASSSGSSGSDVPDQKSNSHGKSIGGGKHLLPELRVQDVGKKCIVIDLDETLVHSSFKVSRLLCIVNNTTLLCCCDPRNF